MQKQDNIRIQVDNGGNIFTVTDEDGNNFIFQDRDSSGSATGAGSTFATSSWNLSKIKTQLNDSVTFTYTSDNSWTFVAPEIYENYSTYCSNFQGYSRGNPAGTYYLNKTLQAINFSNGQLQFVFDGKRSDLSGGKKLNAVKVYSKSGSTLNFVRENDFYYSYFDPSNGNDPTDSLELKRLRLDSVKEISGSYLTPPYSFLYNPPLGSGPPLSAYLKHGFSVDHWGFFNGISNSTYIPKVTYQYNPPGPSQPGPGLYYTYNGANREADPTAYYTQVFSLQQITYPTGGKTVLSYGQNDYDDQKSRTQNSTDFPLYTFHLVDTFVNIHLPGISSGPLNLSGIVPVLPALSPTTNITIDVFFRGTGNNTVDYHNLHSGLIYFTFTAPGMTYTVDISEGDLQGSAGSWSKSMQLTVPGAPSNCTWTGYVDPSVSSTYFSDINVSLTYQEYLTTYNNNPTLTASGLRVSSITDYSSANTIAKKRLFNYGYQQDKLGTGTPQSYTYGKLMSYPSYARYASNPDQNSYCTSLNLSGSSYNPLTSSISGNIVGYDQVSETTVDPVSGLDIGKTVYSYFNSPDTGISYGGFRLPGTLNIGNNLDGSLLSKTVYADVNGIYNPVFKTVNAYHTANRSIYYSPKYWYPPAISVTMGGGVLCSGDTTTGKETYTCFYPSLKSERVLLDATYEYAYDQSNPANYLLTTKNYNYDNPAHYMTTRINTVDSKGNSLTTRLKYPQDYIQNGNTWTGNSILDTMIGRNMKSEAIEKQDSLYYSGSGPGYITGAQLTFYKIMAANANTVVPDKKYKLDVQSPITNFQPFSFTGNTTSIDSRNRQIISFDQYDLVNNIQQYTTTDQNPITVIWDYGNKYPVAQVKNAVLADAAATSFEADGKGNWIFSGTPVAGTSLPTGNMFYSLSSGNISKTGLTSTTTYIVSYWSNTGASFGVTGTVSIKQGKIINGWTYFEHTVNGITGVTISGTGNIDELRLYPSMAQMTTYTYSPLFGMTTACDVDSRVTYYFYDGLGRLKWIKDQDGNFLKTFQYHYQGQ